MKKPTSLEIANSYALWMEYVDPSGIDSESAFNAMTIAERLEVIQSCFGA